MPPDSTATGPVPTRPGPWGLRVIGAYKLAKALLFVVVGLWIVRLDPTHLVRDMVRLVVRLRLDPDSRLVHRALARLSGLDGTHLEEIGAGVVLYGLLYVVQGVGLILQRRWAEYLVVITTSLLIPFELFELLRRPRPVPAIVLLLNLMIVAYLVVRLRRERTFPARPHAGGDPEDGIDG
jgi:uncharacterized membrane protein (DUF2068 family)